MATTTHGVSFGVSFGAGALPQPQPSLGYVELNTLPMLSVRQGLGTQVVV